MNKQIVKIIDDMAVLQDGTARPVAKNDAHTSNKRLLEKQAQWDEEHVFKVDKCDGFCDTKCSILGCETYPYNGNIFHFDGPFRNSISPRQDFVNLTKNVTADFYKISDKLKDKLFDFSDEKKLQLQLESVFKGAGFVFNKEHQFDKKSTVDFFMPHEGLAIEVKIKGSAMAIYRQLERYAKQDSVKAIVLISAKAMTLPEKINDKPAYVFNLSKAWL